MTLCPTITYRNLVLKGVDYAKPCLLTPESNTPNGCCGVAYTLRFSDS